MEVWLSTNVFLVCYGFWMVGKETDTPEPQAQEPAKDGLAVTALEMIPLF